MLHDVIVEEDKAIREELEKEVIRLDQREKELIQENARIKKQLAAAQMFHLSAVTLCPMCFAILRESWPRLGSRNQIGSYRGYWGWPPLSSIHPKNDISRPDPNALRADRKALGQIQRSKARPRCLPLG